MGQGQAGQHAALAADRSTRPKPQRKPITPDPPTREPAQLAPDPVVQKALNGTQGAVLRCEKQYGATPVGTQVVLMIGSDGAVKSVAFLPERLESTLLGACIATVFRAVAFPHGDENRRVAINVRRQT